MDKKNITGVSAPSGARIKLADAVPLDTPLIVQIFDMYACNLACKFCHYGLPKEKRPKLSTKKVMDLKLYKKIVDDMTAFKKKVKLWRFCGAGESLLDKNIVEMVRYASEKQIAENIELITNGVLLTPAMSTALIEAGLTRLRVSIYGLSSETYKELCLASVDFDEILNNVRFFYEENIRSGHKTGVYVKTMNCSLDAEDDEAKFVQLFGPYCDSYAVESVVPNVQGIDYSVWLKDGTPNYNALGVKLPAITVCPQPFHLVTICPDGRVVPCSNETMRGIGNCNEQSMTDIWRGEVLRECQCRMLDGTVSYGGVCETCTVVQCRPFPEDILDHDVERLKTFYEQPAEGSCGG
ncbi:MAG: radical SAM protein [Deltaproteobacteria bacterium]|nr:radical SAM protein [Deltaproteobacteria bacterium]